MQTLFITRNFLKNPIKSLPYFLLILCFSVLTLCAISPEIWQRLRNISIIKSVLIFTIPEVVTILIMLALIHIYHTILKINSLLISLKGIFLYQLKILPVFLVAYFIFYPFTFSVRYLILFCPNISFGQWLLYLDKSSISESYFLYLPSISILGYLLLNISLTHDYFRQSSEFITKKYIVKNSLKTEIVQARATNEEAMNEPSQYLNIIKTRGLMGDTFLRVDECYYFEASDHSSLVYHSEGIFRVSLSIISLHKQLDPECFFKNNPKYILNLAYLDSYIYTEKGQYTLIFKKPVVVNLSTTKSKIGTLKSAFHKYRLRNIAVQNNLVKSLPALSEAD